jgi:transposase-like protein
MKLKKTCPYCILLNEENSQNTLRKGSFVRKCDGLKVKRFFCKNCLKWFSDQTSKSTFRLKKKKELKNVELLLVSGVSKRRIALLTRLNRATVQRYSQALSSDALAWQKNFLSSKPESKEIQFDDLETFEHTKMKPLSVALGVEKGTRLILGAFVNRMPAKGHLAQKSRAKYGPRPDERSKGWHSLLEVLKTCTEPCSEVTSDENPHYLKYVKKYLPHANHTRVPGGRGCIAGYGELKKKGFDPMFSLNHTCAMFRDNIACLKRKTWTTTKKPENLQQLINIYIRRHNELILAKI